MTPLYFQDMEIADFVEKVPLRYLPISQQCCHNGAIMIDALYVPAMEKTS
jgi:hypothetical protein